MYSSWSGTYGLERMLNGCDNGLETGQSSENLIGDEDPGDVLEYIDDMDDSYTGDEGIDE